MLHNLLDFAVITLVDQGRLCFWMPTADDDEGEGHTSPNDRHVSNVNAFEIPTHSSLELLSVCVQTFNKCKFGITLSLLFFIIQHLWGYH